MHDRKLAPEIKQAIDFDISLEPYRKTVLKNDVPVYYIRAGAEDVSSFEFVFHAGNSFENKTLVASATSRLLKNGTAKKTALQINEDFEYYGAYVNQHVSNKTATFSLYCLSKYVPVLLPMIREIITEAVFPDEEVEIFKHKAIQKLSVNMEKCDFVANRKIDGYLYGNTHSYGRTYFPADIEALSAVDLRDFFREWYLNGQLSVFAAGKLPANFDKLLNDNFGDLPFRNPVETPVFSVEAAAEKKYRVNNDDDGVQGAIRIARLLPGCTDSDFHKLMVLNTVFGGYFGSRLMMNIREEKGYTYGIYSYFQSRTDVSGWVISTEAGRDVSEATVEEVYREMEILKTQPPGKDELLLVKNYMLGQYLGYTDGPFQTMSRWRSLITQGLDENYFNDTIQTIKSIKASELHELANKYFEAEKFYELIVV